MDNKTKAICDELSIYIKEELDKRGLNIPIGAILAQFMCETGNFKSTLWTKYFNPAGLKCGSTYKGKSVNLKTKEEYTPGTLTTIKDNFRVADNAKDGVAMYFKFICGYKRYANAINQTTSISFWQALKEAGFATSSTYVETLKKFYNNNQLYLYDVTSSPSKDDIKDLQRVLNRLNNSNLKIDGIVGPLTRREIKNLYLKYC